MPPFPPSTPITWCQVYADPAAMRRIVADALRNPECRVAEGQVRLDLREVCAADAIARLAILQQQCGVILDNSDYERRAAPPHIPRCIAVCSPTAC